MLIQAGVISVLVKNPVSNISFNIKIITAWFSLNILPECKNVRLYSDNQHQALFYPSQPPGLISKHRL